MIKNLKGTFEGAVIGMLGGLVIGISETDWIRVPVTLAIIAYAGIALRGDKPVSAIHS